MSTKLIITAVAAVGVAITTGSFSQPLPTTKDTPVQLTKAIVKVDKTDASTKDLASVKTLEEKADQEGQQLAAQKAADDAKAQAEAEAQAQTQVETNTQQTTTVQPTATAYKTAAATTATSQSRVSTSSTSTQTASGDINWLIQRESGGNTNATNGQFYGIGQLSPAAYTAYAAGQDTSSYSVQLSAMQGYIADRYGSVSNAIIHFQNNGWY